ncbi:class I SAM-dependent methyltransferase [Segniliparus rugosus]|uniref:Uncharacterized protein n=1 Tax=Segniliparus rugosus (strain ATCC BAA-974 / DSM 45345 / CCUG 50838 / CIP 108380 / JCM 13579 / CDC 945) TaxID=679197 RepID=E5XV36_SEGRC|nr:class I SAM-dependent methyltransferase [Segniliparus rugosus]EFV11872.1 hypothetical protein HMPREF9336_03358 [Segniliparus rugosus ATCC BAA-974]
MQKLDGKTLTDVSETALLTLWSRGSEAARADSIINDPLAARLLDRIEYPYRRHFGPPNQFFAIRAATFDRVARGFLREHPNGTIIALAEGLQTSYWRLGRPPAPWISVDLPPIVALREQLLPKEEHVVHAGTSALDLSWADHVQTGAPVLITAEGLLYYLDKPLALGLIRDCAARFPGGRFVFDSLPTLGTSKTGTLLAKAQLRANKLLKRDFVMPTMPFSMHVKEIRTYPRTIPGVASARQVPVTVGRGIQGWGVQKFYQSPLIPSRLRGTITELRFSE